MSYRQAKQELEKTLPKNLKKTAEKYPELTAQYSRNASGDFEETSFRDLYQTALDFAGGLLDFGVTRGDRIGLISDNRKEWEQADMGLLALGCVDTPRGCDATEADLSYILSFSECKIVIGENNSQLKKFLNIRDKIPLVKTIILFDPAGEAESKKASENGIQIFQFTDVVKKGKEWRKSHPQVVEQELEKGQWDDLATIIFTSGTTGTPKGVMLTHGNFISQLDDVNERIFLNPGERALVVLPVWHAFQRACEYVIITQGAGMIYSKPIGNIMLADFAKMNPHLMPAVPRVWEAIYDGIWKKMRKAGGLTYALFRFFVGESMLWCSIDRKLRRKNARFSSDHLGLWWPILVLPWLLLYPPRLLGKALVFNKLKKLVGNNFRSGIAGGGAYPEAIDKFFWAVGIKVVEGYGLTETSPIVSVRPIAAPIMRTVGTPIRGLEARVVDDNGQDLGRCRKGSLQLRGPTVMQGYYKRDDLTSKVIDKDGWFDTGDLAILTLDNEIQLRGRKKDTIVLMGGENIEPVPIEQMLATSRYIVRAVVFGTNEKGQDQRNLVALIQPSQDDIEEWAKNNDIVEDSYDKILQRDEFKKLITDEINTLISSKNGFKAFEKIAKFDTFTKDFEVGVEMSAKQEMMRFKVAEIYKDKIAKLYK